MISIFIVYRIRGFDGNLKIYETNGLFGDGLNGFALKSPKDARSAYFSEPNHNLG